MKKFFLPTFLTVLIACTLLCLPTAQAVPPELPREFIDTTYNPAYDRPADLVINDTGDPIQNGILFQQALEDVLPGEIIELEAGAIFRGNFWMPNKGEDDRWIYIRSSAHAMLPPPGTRIGPEHAQFMPKIVSPFTNTYPVIMTMFGAHHYRFVGIEISTDRRTVNLVLLGSNMPDPSRPWHKERADTEDKLPHHITFDRVYVHSTSDLHRARTGILADGRYIAVIDSYLSNFKDRSDAQAIAAWQGTGPFKIVNNFLEATGENILFGGESTLIQGAVPSDAEIRGNHFAKRREWDQNLVKVWSVDAGGFIEPDAEHPVRDNLVQAKWNTSYEFIFRDWTIKNLFELKLAQRVLIKGNIFEHNWLDGQSGTAILFTVANQNGDTPWAVVQDVLFESNIIRRSTQGFLIIGDRPLTQQTQRITIHNNLLEDIDRRFFLINAAEEPLLDFTVIHNTLLHTTVNEGSIMTMEGSGNTLPFDAANVIWNDNLVSHGAFGISNSGGPGGKGSMDLRFDGYQFIKNVLFGNVRNDAANYPVNNYHPQDISEVGFENVSGGNYRLSEGSPYKNRATDGTDIGADMDALLFATRFARSGDPSQSARPGALQFHSSDVDTTEDIDTVAIYVRRISGVSGVVTIDYTTEDGTALAGRDYVATSGTLTWEEGDGEIKRISIPIVNDSVKEIRETFNLRLSDPIGGASLVPPDSAVITILDDEIDTNFGLLGHWNFDEGSETTAADSSGNGNHGRLTNGPAWAASGAMNGALEFDGVDDYVDLGDQDAWEFGPQDAFTVSFWLKAYPNSANQTIFGRINEWNHTRRTWIIFMGGGLYFFLADGARWSQSIIQHETGRDIWYQVLVSVGEEGGDIRSYVDGFLVRTETRTIGQLRQTDGAFRIGGEDRYFFKGLIDEVRLYDRLLNDVEIAELASGGSNRAPVVSDIPDQAVGEGNSFATIKLDDFVSDPDNVDSELSWGASGQSELSVTIQNRVATITAPNADWTGFEQITFTVTDPGNLSDSDAATFKVGGGGGVVYGDADGNGSFGPEDLNEVVDWLVGRKSTPVAGSPRFVAADVDGDGAITPADLNLMVDRLIGKIDKFPVEG